MRWLIALTWISLHSSLCAINRPIGGMITSFTSSEESG